MSTRVECDGCNKTLAAGAIGIIGKCWIDYSLDYSEFKLVPLSRKIHICPDCTLAGFRAMAQDLVAEFGLFIKRHIARKGEISTEEMAALYKDFHGVELRKE